MLTAVRFRVRRGGKKRTEGSLVFLLWEGSLRDLVLLWEGSFRDLWLVLLWEISLIFEALQCWKDQLARSVWKIFTC